MNWREEIAQLNTQKAIYRIKRIEGIDYLVQILQALGKETLDRNSFYHNFSYYWSGTDKKEKY